MKPELPRVVIIFIFYFFLLSFLMLLKIFENDQIKIVLLTATGKY